ncbi:TonB-dependent receptor [Bacteroides sp. 214]|uniref:SusC/RagA family TonB-linked outer membrane protein n=1 Tax=Bacteroides sp. 214 TaxID=2302935 RepID=UPI0013D6FB35|nr:TonB-dependent receptor [Bacteroides sp. 214]NDW12204.1 TonB-dependent receptor [Bacteroides sp. 214]
MKYNSIFKLTLSVLLAFIMSLSAYAQQTQTFSGVVVDEAEEPVIGASVKILGTSTGVITDIDGRFTLKVAKEQVVEISFMGYTPIKVTDFKQTRFVLKGDAMLLDEVVVVGYGTQKKAHLTGAIATVPMDDIQDISTGNLSAALSGMVNGLSVSGGQSRPGESGRIYIRDTNSLSDVGVTAQEPLYVIDGYIYPNDVKTPSGTENLGATAFNNLDASAVESISVLKDAAAAVYGARAANGVILVTTKKGKLGAPQVSYTGSFGFTDEVARPKMLSAYNYGRLYNITAAGDPKNTSLNHTTDLFQADELQAMKGLNYDLLDKYWKTGITQRHSVNIGGATEKANYYANVSYFDQEGNLGRLDYNRWNYRAGVDVKISKWLKVNLGVAGDYGKKNKPNVKVGGSNPEKDYNLLLTRPYYIPEEINGYYIPAYGISNTQKTGNQNYSYAVLQDNGDYTRNMTSNMSINGNVEYDFGWSKYLKGLNLKLSYSKSINNSKNNQYASDYTIYEMINRTGSGAHLYTPVAGQDYDPFIAESNFSPMKLSNGSNSLLSRNMTRTDNYQINFTVSYARTFGLHNVSGMFAIEKSEAEMEYLYGDVSQVSEMTTGQSNLINQGSEQTTTFTRSESGTMSYIGRANYTYNDKYLLEFLLRSDASTKFAPRNYWGTFPSVSAGWIISQEKWMAKVKWVDYLKVRGSFGLTGRDNTTAWQWLQTYSASKGKGPVFGVNNNASSQLTMNNNNAAVNTDVHWDKSYKANFGIDFTTLNSRLSFNIDGYYVWNREMLMRLSQEISTVVGTESAFTNLGKTDNYGIEFSATWRDKIGKDFKYRISVNTGYTDNKVLLMDFETERAYKEIRKGHRSDIGTWGMQCIGMFRSFQDIEEYFAKYNISTYMGMSKDQVRPGMLMYKDVRGSAQQPDGSYGGPDGIVDSENDQVRLSNRSNPYGFTTNMSAEWKGISLTAQISASWGGYSQLPSAAYKPADGLEVTNMPSFWKPEDVFVYEDIYDGSGNLLMPANHGAKYPNLKHGVNAQASSFWRVSGTRVSLNRLTLAYAIPKKYTNYIGIQSCRFNLTGQNLLSLYNPYPDNFMDPMCSYGNYPTLRTFTLGVNVTF